MTRHGKVVTREQLLRSVASSSALSNNKTVEENEKMLKQEELEELLSVVEKFKVRCDLWSKAKVYNYKQKMHAAVNYHWGAHHGMVDRSKEAVEMYKALTPLLEHYQRIEQEFKEN